MRDSDDFPFLPEKLDLATSKPNNAKLLTSLASVELSFGKEMCRIGKKHKIIDLTYQKNEFVAGFVYIQSLPITVLCSSSQEHSAKLGIAL